MNFSQRHRLDINFAPSGWRRTLHEVQLAVWGLLLCGTILTASAIGVIVHKQRQHDAFVARYNLQRAQSHLAEDEAARAVAQVPLTLPARQANAINAIVRQLNLPWRDLKNALALASSPKVALLAVEPDAMGNTVRMTAETRNSSDMIGYIEVLKHQPFFTDVRLLRHQQNEQDENRPIRFELRADTVRGRVQAVQPSAFAAPSAEALP